MAAKASQQKAPREQLSINSILSRLAPLRRYIATRVSVCDDIFFVCCVSCLATTAARAVVDMYLASVWV